MKPGDGVKMAVKRLAKRAAPFPEGVLSDLRERGRRNIYLVTSCNHPLDKALKFGQIKILSEVNRHEHVSKAFRIYAEALKDSSPNDLILISSLQILNIGLAIMFHQMHGKINVLLWHPRRKDYIERTYTFLAQPKNGGTNGER